MRTCSSSFPIGLRVQGRMCRPGCITQDRFVRMRRWLNVMMVLALWRCMAWGQIGLVPWANGIGQAVYVTHCGDHRLFAVSQWGAIFIIEDSMQVRDVPFLDIHERVVNNGE